jgi:hypothetical protein
LQVRFFLIFTNRVYLILQGHNKIWLQVVDTVGLKAALRKALELEVRTMNETARIQIETSN